jgi:hypothetical protein
MMLQYNLMTPLSDVTQPLSYCNLALQQSLDSREQEIIARG